MAKKEKLSRKVERANKTKERLVISISSLLVIIALAVAYYSDRSTIRISAPSWITVISTLDFEEDGKTVTKMLSEPFIADAVQAAIEWDEKYGCNRSITVEPLADQQYENYDDKFSDVTVEMAEAGKIQLLEMPDISYTMKHAMTHACKQEPVLFEDKPIRFPVDNSELIGFEGLGIIVRLPNGRLTKFTKFEEGAAEALANGIEQRRLEPHRYTSLTLLTEKYFGDDQEHSLQELRDIVWDSDIWKFVAIITGKDVTAVSEQDLFDVMTMYQGVY